MTAIGGAIAGPPDVVTFEGATLAKVERASRHSVDDYLAFCADRGEPPDRPYSGRSRGIDPELHRRACPGREVSLNQSIAGRLEQVLVSRGIGRDEKKEAVSTLPATAPRDWERIRRAMGANFVDFPQDSQLYSRVAPIICG